MRPEGPVVAITVTGSGSVPRTESLCASPATTSSAVGRRSSGGDVDSPPAQAISSAAHAPESSFISAS
jgi:hypothetical protein